MTLIVFTGPSLPANEARRIARCTVLPPARAGDVWRALTRSPTVIALIDGVFEGQPSVWHKELVAALQSGVAVVGGSSMGALRASELDQLGMIGVGKIYGWIKDGTIRDDAEVALLHGPAELGFRAMTLPLVNVRWAAELARQDHILSRDQARTLVSVAESIFFKDRTWRTTLAALEWRSPLRTRFETWLAATDVDLKRHDAIACIQTAAALARLPESARAAPAALDAPWPSSLVRRRQLAEVGGSAPEPTQGPDDLDEQGARGLRRALLADWARQLGARLDPRERARWEKAWIRSNGRGALARHRLDRAGLQRLATEVLLERWMLKHASRLISDGPSLEEARAAEARLACARDPGRRR